MAKTIPGWRILQTLGEGGQATVYLAVRDGSAGEEKFVLKVLRQACPQKARSRFVAEIAALQRIDHPRIVKVVDSRIEEAGPNYFVMEYVEGAMSLRQLINKGQNPFHHDEIKSTKMFIGIAEALIACEANQIVHRDLSPANVLILPDESVKVIDFGLCYFEEGERHTLVEENVGTPNYLAPELEAHADKKASVASDLYSAGKILWTAITSKGAFAREEPAFRGKSMTEIFPESENKWHVQRLIERTVRRDIEERFVSASQAAAVARRVLGLMEAKVPPVETLNSRCPICRLGELGGAEQVFPVGGYLLFGQSHPQGVSKKVCRHCGYCFLVAADVWKQTVDQSRKLS